MPLADFYRLVKPKISTHQNNDLPTEFLYLKGGDLTEELRQVKCQYTIFSITDFFSEPYFETKKIVHLFS